MLLRRLALIALSVTAIACTVSPIPSASPVPSGSRDRAEEPRVRAVVERYVEALDAGGKRGVAAVESVDVTGDAAAVKVVETYPGDVQVDYLNLARESDGWRIVNEVSARSSR